MSNYSKSITYQSEREESEDVCGLFGLAWRVGGWGYFSGTARLGNNDGMERKQVDCTRRLRRGGVARLARVGYISFMSMKGENERCLEYR